MVLVNQYAMRKTRIVRRVPTVHIRSRILQTNNSDLHSTNQILGPTCPAVRKL